VRLKGRSGLQPRQIRINKSFFMKITISKNLWLCSYLLAGLPAELHAQNYSIGWHKIAGGGGSSSNGQYSVSGTIGQADASGAVTGGNYSVTGGFWSIMAAMQTAGFPNLTIQYVKPSSVVISWPDMGSYTLQQNGNLATTNWTASGYAIATANGSNRVKITAPNGNLFFRLANP
jgi:hypothetical protein